MYLLNINRSVNVRTELRIAILKTFKECGVQLPQSPLDAFLKEFSGPAHELGKRLLQTTPGIDLAGLKLGKEPEDLKN